MEKEKNNGLFNGCRLVENYNPYDKSQGMKQLMAN